MLSVGLVGLPNAGKSTLFNLLTKQSVPAENYPFCTIDPSDAIVSVPDARIDKLAEMVNADKKVYATIEFRDIAGLIRGASSGEGLGNQFLSHILEVDLILLVVRAFENDDIIHVENRVSPQDDEEILLMELILHDQARLEKAVQRLQKDAKTDKIVKLKLETAELFIEAFKNNKLASSVVLDINIDQEITKWRRQLNLITDKPVLRLKNISTDVKNQDYMADFELDVALECSLVDMTMQDRAELGVEGETGLDLMIQACFKKLNLSTYLTAGKTEARAWTFETGLKAPQCAGKIHTDFEKKFIMADVVSYQDYVDNGGEKGCKEKGLYRMEGKNYIMKDGDVVEFKIGG